MRRCILYLDRNLKRQMKETLTSQADRTKDIHVIKRPLPFLQFKRQIDTFKLSGVKQGITYHWWSWRWYNQNVYHRQYTPSTHGCRRNLVCCGICSSSHCPVPASERTVDSIPDWSWSTAQNSWSLRSLALKPRVLGNDPGWSVREDRPLKWQQAGIEGVQSRIPGNKIF